MKTRCCIGKILAWYLKDISTHKTLKRYSKDTQKILIIYWRDVKKILERYSGDAQKILERYLYKYSKDTSKLSNDG